MASVCVIFLAFASAFIIVDIASCSKIACFPMFGGSQYLVMKLIGEELADRGHEVSLVVSSNQKIKKSEKLEHKIFNIPYDAGYLEKEIIGYGIKEGMLKMMLKMTDALKETCHKLLGDKELLDSLKDYDLMITDIAMLCAPLVADLLNIKRVEICPAAPNVPLLSYRQSPMPVSYVPNLMLSGFSDKMSFLQRVANFAAYIMFSFVQDVMFAAPYTNMKKEYNISPEKSYQEAVGEAELLLITADFALEYPQPLMPGAIMVGALNVKQPQPLSPDMEQFVASSGDHGIVMVSFGSNVASALDRTLVDMMSEAFGKLKQKVVWRWKGYIPSSLSPNIKLVEWLPQNDLLAHPKTKAFISHVGHNSLYEAAYRGVPLVAAPLFGDQYSNAHKAEHFGIGLAVDLKTTSAEKLIEAIERVIYEPRFKESVTRISRLLSDRRRTSVEESADWVEYVLRHGGARHLRPEVFNIPWYQFYLLDVIAFLFAVVTVILLVLWMFCRCVCRLCCRRSESKPKKE